MPVPWGGPLGKEIEEGMIPLPPNLPTYHFLDGGARNGRLSACRQYERQCLSSCWPGRSSGLSLRPIRGRGRFSIDSPAYFLQNCASRPPSADLQWIGGNLKGDLSFLGKSHRRIQRSQNYWLPTKHGDTDLVIKPVNRVAPHTIGGFMLMDGLTG